jgi:hypothetical protein
VIDSWQCSHHNIGTKSMRWQNVVPDRTETTPNQVARHGISHSLRDDEAKAGHVGFLASAQVEHGMRSEHTPTSSHGHPEIIGTDDPVRSREHGRKLRREFGAALATTCSQDGAAGAGAHAKTEAVHLGAATVIRLEGSLAHSGISKAQLERPEEVGMAGGPEVN